MFTKTLLKFLFNEHKHRFVLHCNTITPEYNILFKTLKGNKWKLGKVKPFKLDVKMKVHNSYRCKVLKC